MQKCWPCKNGWQVSEIWEMFIILELWIHSIPLYSCISHCPCVWDLTFRWSISSLGCRPWCVKRIEASHRKSTRTDCEIWIDVPVIPHKYTVHSQNHLFQRPITEINTRICLDRESLWVPDVYMLLTNPSTRNDLFKIILMPSMVITKRGGLTTIPTSPHRCILKSENSQSMS